MHISLTPELETRIKAKVESGLYNNASEVIREALRFMETNEEWIREIRLARLRVQLQIGVDQLTQGQGIKVTSKDGLDRLFDEILTSPQA
jgi:antitoxin ParD1/3/4